MSFVVHADEALSIMAELLPDKTTQCILEERDQPREARLDLLRWAHTVRSHAAAPQSV
jgi:hypothetical protein